LSNETHLSGPVVQASLLSQIYVSLLSIPNVEMVFWYAYIDTDPNQNFTLEPVSKAAYETLSKTMSNTIPLGRYPIESDTGDPLHGLYE
jgi:hypothetical protein